MIIFVLERIAFIYIMKYQIYHRFIDSREVPGRASEGPRSVSGGFMWPIWEVLVCKFNNFKLNESKQIQLFSMICHIAIRIRCNNIMNILVLEIYKN